MSLPHTYFVSDQRMLMHKCEWDETHIEMPSRLSTLTHLLEHKGVLDKCQVLDSKLVELEDLYRVHSVEYVDKIRHTQDLNQKELEEYSASHEDIYVNEHTWLAAQLSAGCAVELIQNVLRNPNSNGFAAIRPPGHHASYEQPCGFCIFNNVAICAKKARSLGCQRVLILDWDVHAAQGTQYCIEDDPGVRLISIHSFQQGTFWPELPESAAVQPYKNTINLPLNQVGLGDGEYIQVFHSLVLPFIEHWAPDLILVSAGYDAAIGDPQGKMEVSPGGFGYMTGVLASLNISLCLLLEGGYCIESVAYGALYSMHALLDRKSPSIHLDLSPPCAPLLQSLHSTIAIYQHTCSIFGVWIDLLNHYRQKKSLPAIECPKDEYHGHRVVKFPYQTRGLYKPLDKEAADLISERLRTIMNNYHKSTTHKKPDVHVNLDRNELKITTTDAQYCIELTKISRTQYMVICFYMLAPLTTAYNLLVNGQDIVDPSGLLKKSWPECEHGSDYFSDAVKEQLEKIINAFSLLENLFLF